MADAETPRFFGVSDRWRPAKSCEGVQKLSLAGLALSLMVGCASHPPNPRLDLQYEDRWESVDLEGLLRRAPRASVHVVTLGSTAWVSHHVAIVRTQELPHYHRFHDLTVTVLRGEGTLQVGSRAIPMKSGDVAYVRRGTPHFFRNTGDGPAVAFVVFSPPFDGRDTVDAKEASQWTEPTSPSERPGPASETPSAPPSPSSGAGPPAGG